MSVPPIDSLLPHAGLALYLTRIVESDESQIVCEAAIDPESPFRDRAADTFPAFLGLEMGAQAAAAHEGVLRASSGDEAEPTGGFVVRIRRATFARPALAAGTSYRASARLLEAAPPLRTYAVRLEAEGEVLVEGEVSTFAG